MPEITNANQVGLAWNAPSFAGGSPVIDYRLWYDNSNGGTAFQELSNSISALSYTVQGLT
jgi:hypothetical protein